MGLEWKTSLGHFASLWDKETEGGRYWTLTACPSRRLFHPMQRAWPVLLAKRVFRSVDPKDQGPCLGGSLRVPTVRPPPASASPLMMTVMKAVRAGWARRNGTRGCVLPEGTVMHKTEQPRQVHSTEGWSEGCL